MNFTRKYPRIIAEIINCNNLLFILPASALITQAIIFLGIFFIYGQDTDLPDIIPFLRLILIVTPILVISCIISAHLLQRYLKKVLQLHEKDQENDERFRNLTELLPEGIFEADANFKVTYANQRAFEIFQYDEGSLEKGIYLLDTIVPEDRKKMLDNVAKRIQNINLLPQRYRAIKKDGTVFPILIHAKVIRKYNEVVGFIGILMDLSEQEKVEEEILRLRKLKSVGLLAGGIAHDFNNFLTGIFGNIELAKMLIDPDHKAHELLERAGQSMETATNLTKQLLTFARGGEPVKEVLDIGPLIEETGHFALRGSKIGLKTEIDTDLLPVEADKGQLSQVITNLVINAKQAMPTGGFITITARNVKNTETPLVEITVEDQGTGIPPKHLDKIFDPYFSTKQDGSGLGLASAHSIIIKHVGSIRVDSQLNRGTIFTIQLPATTKRCETRDENTPCTETPGFSASILVMDDESAVRKILCAMLEIMGHKPSSAKEGGEAVEKYQKALEAKAPYDLVIADLTVPGAMGGLEMAKNILDINPDAKIIVSSGYSTDPVMANFKDFGFIGRVGKPYRFVTLQSVIQEVLEQGREHPEIKAQN